jgi:hypothetical protein
VTKHGERELARCGRLLSEPLASGVKTVSSFDESPQKPSESQEILWLVWRPGRRYTRRRDTDKR